MSSLLDEELEWQGRWEEPINKPIMIVALRGPFDAAGGATGAIRHLTKIYKAEPHVRIDSDGFFDFTGERPIIRIKSKDNSRRIHWPETECKAVRFEKSDENSENDLLLVSGTEPHLRWKTFTRYLLRISEQAGVEKIVTLGSFASIEPHTRSSGVGGSTSHEELTKQLGLSEPKYQGPTGVIGVLNTWAQGTQTPVISLRVGVPDYATSAPSPEASRSLLARLELITGIKTDYFKLEASAQEWRKQLDLAMVENEELAEYVGRLEERIDASDDILPTGEDLGAQIEAYLRRDNDSEQS